MDNPTRNVEIVRQRLTVGTSSRRRVLDRLSLRLPRAAAILMRLVLRLPPRLWLRRVLIRDAFRRAVEAINRGDLEAAFALIPSDYEMVTPPDLGALGFDPVYRGRAGRLRFHRQWMAELGEWRNEPEEILDLGDLLLLLGHMKGTGASSGLGFDSEVAFLFILSGGRVVREEEFRSHAEALEAAGVRNQVGEGRAT
jgi:ketosteroid isomerase-like protein